MRRSFGTSSIPFSSVGGPGPAVAGDPVHGEQSATTCSGHSAGDKALIAALGKYLSPVTLDFFPDFVRHFCFDQDLKDLCLLDNAITYNRHQLSYTAWQVAVLF